MSLLVTKNISLKYPRESSFALNDVNVVVDEGRITQFLGKSGSGKTTLLKCFANLLKNYTGQIILKDQAINTMSSRQRASIIGFVSQSFDLFPHMSALENCTHPQIHVLNRSKEKALNIAKAKLCHLGMEDFLERYPNALSGGQKQRVSIARALCMNSKLLLLDEPTSALDPESSKKLVEILRLLNSEGITIALSTHDMTFSKYLMDKVYFMEKGRVVEELDIKNKKLDETTCIKKFFEV